jgi:hypothetical protein
MPLSQLRAKNKLRVADSIHLASAAAAGIDLLLTEDKQLMVWICRACSLLRIQYAVAVTTPPLCNKATHEWRTRDLCAGPLVNKAKAPKKESQIFSKGQSSKREIQKQY